MDSTRISYRPRPDATPEGEVQALSEVYRFILQSRNKDKRGARFAASDGTKEFDDGRTKPSIQR